MLTKQDVKEKISQIEVEEKQLFANLNFLLGQKAALEVVMDRLPDLDDEADLTIEDLDSYQEVPAEAEVAEAPESNVIPFVAKAVDEQPKPSQE